MLCLQARSEIIATYAICGSASIAVMGLIIGSFEALVPHRIEEITKHIFRALIAGTVASYLTACFAGMNGPMYVYKYAPIHLIAASIITNSLTLTLLNLFHSANEII